MKIIVLGLSICLLVGTGDAIEPGVITGRVIITRVLTKKRVSLPVYSLRGAPAGLDNAQRLARQPAQIDELSRIVIYLEGAGLPKAPPVTATLSQKNRTFDPDLVVVPVGSIVSFPNEDPIFHNVFSLSEARTFDLGYYPQGKTRKVRFDRPGVIQVYCHIHNEMSAAILVVPNTFWTRPSSNGTFSFKNVPAGTYELVVWHRSAGMFRRQIKAHSMQKEFVTVEVPVREPGRGNSLEARGSR